MRVLMTGATGFVGRQVLKGLLARKATVTAVVRPDRPHPPGTTRLELVDAFATDADRWSAHAAGHDTVCHVAWFVDPDNYLQSTLNFACMGGTLALARGAAAAGVTRFVGIGTCFEYDLATSAPLGTDAALAPRSIYAATKAATWKALAESLPQMGVSLAWCRLFYLYGEGEDPRRLVPYLRARLSAGLPADLSHGQQVRDFMDVARAGDAVAAVTTGTCSGAVNICSGQPVTIADLARQIAAQYGRPDLLRLGARPARPDDPAFVVGRPTPLKELA